MVDSQEKEVIKAILGSKGEEESLEDTDYLDSTEGSPAVLGSRGFPASRALQAQPG